MNIKKAVPKEKRKIPDFSYYGYACGYTYTSSFLSTNKIQIFFLCGKMENYVCIFLIILNMKNCLHKGFTHNLKSLLKFFYYCR